MKRSQIEVGRYYAFAGHGYGVQKVNGTGLQRGRVLGVAGDNVTLERDAFLDSSGDVLPLDPTIMVVNPRQVAEPWDSYAERVALNVKVLQKQRDQRARQQAEVITRHRDAVERLQGLVPGAGPSSSYTKGDGMMYSAYSTEAILGIIDALEKARRTVVPMPEAELLDGLDIL